MQTLLFSYIWELHSFFCFLSHLQKQNYLLANYEGPESSYWVHISLTLISEWMAASLVSWLAFKHADCWASLDSTFMIYQKKKKKTEREEGKNPQTQIALHKHFWDAIGANFPSLLFCKLSLWKQTHLSSTLSREANREFGLYLQSYGRTNISSF